MHIKDWKGVQESSGSEEVQEEEEEILSVAAAGNGGFYDSKRVLVGAGARILFYPTLLYNVVRNKFQAEFRWWDQIEEFLLLGAVPFPTDVKRLKDLGVHGVITLNEPYETLVPTSLYKAHGIDHLVLPTRDYLFAPSINDICQAVNFIYEKTLLKEATYVHCKAGRGRSTTIVICYLVQHKQMSPEAAYAYVKSIRPRVLLASAQWQVILEYYHVRVKKAHNTSNLWSDSTIQSANMILRPLRLFPSANLFTFDDGSVVLITKADLDGYDQIHGSGGVVGGKIWTDMRLICRVRVAGQAALARLSCLWFRYDTGKIAGESRCLTTTNQVGGLSVDIHFY